MEKSLKSIALNHGIYLGLLLVLLTVTIYVIDIGIFANWWVNIILLFIIITFSIISVSKVKKRLGGFISFKNAFTAYFITIAIGLLISTIVSILLFNVIDPDSAIILKEKIVENTAKMMQNFGAPENVINETITKMQEEESQLSFTKQLTGFVMQLAFYSIIGLIIAAVMKKKDPNLE